MAKPVTELSDYEWQNIADHYVLMCGALLLSRNGKPISDAALTYFIDHGMTVDEAGAFLYDPRQEGGDSQN